MSRREYREAEGRLRESIALRVSGLANHTYPGRDRDLETMVRHHEAVGGVPPEGYFACLWWVIKRGVVR